MSYTINKTDGTIVATVEDGVLDTTTSLQLIGRNYQSYGEPFNENLVKLLENSASTTAPTAPLTGELWYDKSAEALKVYDGSNFNPVSIRNSSSAPTTGLSTGTLWNDTTNDQLYMYDGSAFDLIGPIFKQGDGKSGFLVDVEDLSGGGTANVLSLYQDGTRVAILTKTARTLDSTPTGFASATLNAGLTLYQDSDSTTFRLHGTAQNALELGGSPASTYLVNNANQSTTGTFAVVNNTGLTVGASSDATLSISSSDLVITQNNVDKSILFNINNDSTVTTALTITDTADVNVAGNLTVQGNLTTVGAASSTAANVLSINDEDGNSGSRDSNQNAGLLIDGSEASTDVTFQVNGADGGPLRSSSGLSVASGKAYDIAGTDVLSGTTLGSTIVTSSLTAVGVLASGSIAIGFGDIDVGDSNFVAAGTGRFGALVLPSTGNSDDSSTATTVDNFSDDAQMTSANPEKTLVSERAIKQFVSEQIAGVATDLHFALDTSGLNTTQVGNILTVLAPPATLPVGTKARIASIAYSPTSSSSHNPASIGNPESVTTTTSLNTARNITAAGGGAALIYTIVSGPSWSYTSGSLAS